MGTQEAGTKTSRVQTKDSLLSYELVLIFGGFVNF